jgi:hypothetical protein
MILSGNPHNVKRIYITIPKRNAQTSVKPLNQPVIHILKQASIENLKPSNRFECEQTEITGQNNSDKPPQDPSSQSKHLNSQYRPSNPLGRVSNLNSSSKGSNVFKDINEIMQFPE